MSRLIGRLPGLGGEDVGFGDGRGLGQPQEARMLGTEGRWQMVQDAPCRCPWYMSWDCAWRWSPRFSRHPKLPAVTCTCLLSGFSSHHDFHPLCSRQNKLRLPNSPPDQGPLSGLHGTRHKHLRTGKKGCFQAHGPPHQGQDPHLGPLCVVGVHPGQVSLSGFATWQGSRLCVKKLPYNPEVQC